MSFITSYCLYLLLIYRQRDLVGIFLCILGALSVVSSAKPTDTRLSMEGLINALKQPLFIAYSILSLVGSILLAIISEGNKGREWVWVDVGLCAIFGGYTVLATKGLSTLLSLELIGIFKEWITYPLVFILLGTGILQIRYLNRALMNFDSKTVIPTQFVFFNLAAIVGSAILYRDFEHVDFHTFLTFVYGCVATFLGVFILTSTSGAASEGKVAGVPGRRVTGTSAVRTITTGTPLVVLDDAGVAPVMEPVGGPATLEGAANAATAGNGGAAAARTILHAKGSRASLSMSPGQVREPSCYLPSLFMASELFLVFVACHITVSRLADPRRSRARRAIRFPGTTYKAFADPKKIPCHGSSRWRSGTDCASDSSTENHSIQERQSEHSICAGNKS